MKFSKLNILRSCTAVILAVASFTAAAQSTESAYFNDEYMYRFQMNPAIGNNRNFVSFPALGNLNIGMQGTAHVKDFLYNINGRTTTFLNPGVSASEFLGNLDNKSRLGVNLRVGVLSAGFKAFGGYNTISINARADINARLPKELFRLMKQGLQNDTYDISDLRASGSAWAEIGLGHSRNINNKLRVGGTLKFLVGGADIDAKFDKAQLVLGENNWQAMTNATINASVKGLTYDKDTNSRTGHEYVSGADIDGAGVNGFGMAVDLGATYKLNNDWTFSAAVLDLGFISWSNNMVASTNGTQTFETDRYTFNVDGDQPNNFDDELDKMKDQLSALYELNDMGDKGGRTTALAATVNLGAEYTFPLYRKLKFGALSTTRINGDFTWTDFRLSANVAPCKIFSASASAAYGTFGFGFGWIINLHTPGFNLYLATDHTPGKLAKQGVPLSSNANVNFGINIPF
ncbi:MAG: DUF5723 family protein [Muribaculum sp.]|nr:DUF5723 family protein [Muribaculaceae bacterium]MCM1080799.1 DUF5723 family protein [Muribaculum sp.]